VFREKRIRRVHVGDRKSRAHATGRPKIAMCKGAYHGAHAWVHSGSGGELRRRIARTLFTFNYNDLESLRQVVEQNSGKVAGVILSPFKHDAGTTIPSCQWKDFWPGVRKICDDNGMVFILDDVRGGFRLPYGRIRRAVWSAARPRDLLQGNRQWLSASRRASDATV